MRWFSVFAHNRLHTGHWVRVDYCIKPYTSNVDKSAVPCWCLLPQQHCWCRGFGVFRQVAASCFTILEISVGNHSCPFSHFHLVSINSQWYKHSQDHDRKPLPEERTDTRNHDASGALSLPEKVRQEYTSSVILLTGNIEDISNQTARTLCLEIKKIVSYDFASCPSYYNFEDSFLRHNETKPFL